VASLPYDVVSTDEARELAGDNPLSMLHVVRAEIDLPPDTDPYSDAVYARAVENFRRLQSEGHLVRERSPCVYVYRQQLVAPSDAPEQSTALLRMHVQRGVVALCHVDDYDAGLIKKHERTRPDKENDRTRLTGALSANPGPVFLTYRNEARISGLVEGVAARPPLFDFTASDGIRHSGWRAGDELVGAFADVPSFYVADGHHRAASAARVARERAAANPDHTGDEDYNWFLCVMFPASELQILPYNRVVHDLNGMTGDELVSAIGSRQPAIGKPQAPPVRMYLNGQWHDLELTPTAADPVSRLPVQMLQERVLAPLLGIDDPRTSDRITFVGGIRGDDYLRKQVDTGKGAVAFALPPVTVDQLMDIADAGQIMPPKSTWFEPKLRSGLFVHTF
jgi:uncharacterized protein (DUF1015 family)